MRNKPRILVGALSASLLALSSGSACAQAAPERIALVGGAVYPSPTDAPIREGVILIDDGKIAAVGAKRSMKIPRDAEILDCSGTTVTAGFWNSHVHFFEKKWANVGALPAAELARQLQEMLTSHGFTSVFDLGSSRENTRQLRERVESGEVAGPRIRATGVMSAAGAVPSEQILSILGFMNVTNPEITDAAQVITVSRKLLDEGVDGIKLHLQPPPPPNPPFPEDAIPAAVAEAHRSGKPVFLHPNDGADVLAAIRAGVDVIAHTTPRSGPWDEAIIASMKDHRVALTPTLTLWKHLLRHDRASTQDKFTATAVGQLHDWNAAGGTVLFGTDVGAVPYEPSEEYAAMADAGMNYRQILASLTTAPAERFGEAQRLGRIAPGFAADLVVLSEDPSRNVRAFAAVRYTMRDGNVIYRTPASADGSTAHFSISFPNSSSDQPPPSAR